MSNISIRVKLPEAPEEYVVKEERFILWDRVLSAAFMAIIALAAVYFVFIFAWSDSGQAPSPQETAVVDTPAIPALEATTKIEAIAQNDAEQLAVPAAVEREPAEVAASPQAPNQEIAATAAPVAVTPAAEPAAVVNSAETLRSAAQKEAAAIIPAVGVEAASVAVPSVNTAQIVAPISSKPAQVAILSEKVQRAVITREMSNRIAGASLSEVVRVKESELLTVYFYTEFDGLKKQTLYYDWYQNGKRRARVTIRPLEENIGNYSSKYITHRMTGDWSVSVSTAAGEKLATAKFEVVNY